MLSPSNTFDTAVDLASSKQPSGCAACRWPPLCGRLTRAASSRAFSMHHDIKMPGSSGASRGLLFLSKVHRMEDFGEAISHLCRHSPCDIQMPGLNI